MWSIQHKEVLMSGTKRGFRTTLGACLVAGATALTVIPASAVAAPQQSDPNPLSSNVPYLAWRGEHVRLVKCEGDLPGTDMEALRAAPKTRSGGLELGVHTDVIVEDWSGNADFKPAVAPGTVDLFLSDDGLCVKADVLSQYAGLAQIKLMVTLDPGPDNGFADVLTRSEILGVHQFLSGWMTLGTPTLTSQNVGGEFAPAGNTDNYDASDAPSDDGVLNVRVNGTLPLGNSFADLGLGSTLTLPAQWPALAGVLASDRNPDNARPAYRWDIHDDGTLAEGHVQDVSCNDQPASTADLALFGDAVDNCEGGLSFSRWFDADGPAGPIAPLDIGRTSPDTIGPFDPQRPDETLLGDGFLTADDAPMPAARIDVAIADNSGAATDTSGIGSLHKNDKRAWDSRDRQAGANAGSGSDAAHNLYAPFYSAYVPATADGSWTLLGTPVSGTDGPAMGNDFPGFLVGDQSGGEGDWYDYDNTYDYWDIAHVFREGLGAATSCLNRLDRSPTNRLLPQGAQSVAVYSDEHGEAQVDYRPGTGAYYDNIAGVVKNDNGGCDLKNVDVLGTSAITAVAKYPYQPTTDVLPKTSATVTKTVHSLFAKFLTQWPKSQTPDSDTAVTRIVVAHAQDVDGHPYAGETVCFVNTSGYGSVESYVYNGSNKRFIGGYDLAGSGPAEDPKHRSPNPVCMVTNEAGNAAVEVSESQHRLVNIVGDFTAEQIRRDFPVDFGAAIPTPQTPGPGTTPDAGGTVTTPPAAGAAGNTAPSTQVNAKVDAIVAAAGKPASAGTGAKKAKACVVRFAHLRTTTKGTRTLMVRLDGGSSAKVRIKLLDKKGKTRVMAVRRLAAGKTVKVSGLKIPKTVVRASIKVIG
jgi:hypothetical protein